jgi:MYXO-CTERM domain-containing protein
MRRLMALTGALVLAGSASADLTGMFFAPIDNGDPDLVTYRAYARFDSPADRIGAFAGLDGKPLFFSTSAPGGIFNWPHSWNGDHIEDIPMGEGNVLDLDTWLTIGQVGGFETFPDFSPDFLGIPGGEELMVLTDGLVEFSHEDSAVYYPGPAKPVNTWGDNDVPIDVALAQFVVEDRDDLLIEFGAVIQWIPEGGEVTQTYLTAEVPGPSAVALLGVAGLAGRRRR